MGRTLLGKKKGGTGKKKNDEVRVHLNGDVAREARGTGKETCREPLKKKTLSAVQPVTKRGKSNT